MAELTQRHRIIGLLLTRGETGFTAFEAIYQMGITRAATYVYDLRKEGWVIGMERKPGETSRYWLISPPVGVKSAVEQETLW